MKSIRSILFFALFVLFLFGLKFSFHDQVHHLGGQIGSAVTKKSVKNENHHKMDELLVENHLLKELISQLRDDRITDHLLSHQIERFLEVHSLAGKDVKNANDLQREAKNLAQRIERQMRFIRAQVVFREPSSWGCHLWIDRGSSNSEDVLQINSPVVVGENIVGVIDFVGKNKSRVQLITDSRLPVSVQVSRGCAEGHNLLQYIEKAKESFQRKEISGFTSQEIEKIVVHFDQLIERIKDHNGSEAYQAKGELFGSSYSLFRKKSASLRGVGFTKDASITSDMIKEYDLLVTTGMDGLFPQGFFVATVTSVDRPREGDIAINIHAKSTLHNLEDIRYVEILPPIKKYGDFKQM